MKLARVAAGRAPLRLNDLPALNECSPAQPDMIRATAAASRMALSSSMVSLTVKIRSRNQLNLIWWLAFNWYSNFAKWLGPVKLVVVEYGVASGAASAGKFRFAAWRSWSYSRLPKKNILFLTIGPPKFPPTTLLPESDRKSVV